MMSSRQDSYQTINVYMADCYNCDQNRFMFTICLISGTDRQLGSDGSFDVYYTIPYQSKALS